MNDELRKFGIEKQFKEALQALAIDAHSQVECTSPGDVPIELCEDYLLWNESYIELFSNEISPKAVDLIKELKALVDDLPDSAFQDTNLESMLRPKWEPLRVKAAQVLALLNWSVESPSSFHSLGNGVYKRD
ncbi:hypothetical protein [Vibrio nigripulchritudo]|uniref:hypothetical protein n=1 Tax=Vibrio nigripulchritudo TaxID=28173 RepID=UPI0005F9BFDB|nr:hypothetical protein [Vibrio nigripulchritudo]KJY78283.1 hypothetical protein TW74_12640 [Vibrio nigripulchritudo]